MSRTKYSNEVKDRAVRMLIEAQSDYPSLWSATQAIAPKIGCTAETLHKWHQTHVDSQIPEKVQAQPDKDRIKQLERENKELAKANEILRRAAAFFAQADPRPQITHLIRFIDDNRADLGVESICTELPIAPSTYYRHKDLEANPHKQSARTQHDNYFKEQILRIWQESGCRYGYCKIWHVLKQEGYLMAHCRIERLMKELGIQGIKRGKPKKTTNSKPEQQRADDLVKRNFTATKPNQLWVADFTYVKTLTGWVYSAFVIDVYAKAIVGWKVATRMTSQLTLDALAHALSQREDSAGVIHHSDRGTQYLSIRFTERMRKQGVIPSVGITGALRA